MQANHINGHFEGFFERAGEGQFRGQKKSRPPRETSRSGRLSVLSAAYRK
jgi:hypothetical protein